MLVGCVDSDDRGMAGWKTFVVRVRIPGAGEEDDVLVAFPLDGLNGLADPTCIASGDTERRENNVGFAGLACPEYGLYISCVSDVEPSSGHNALL